MMRILVLFGLLFHMSLGARLYFIHIPKTAGTTLRHLLEMQIGVDEIYPHRNPQTAKELVHHDVVSGHLFYWLCKELDPDFEKAFKVTILREPIARYLSFLRARIRRDHRYPDLESVMRKRCSPNNPFKLGLLNNAMCRFFADQQSLEGEELLHSAKEGLHKMDCVLFFDTFAKDVVDLFKRLGIVLNEEEISKMNATQHEPVSEELLEAIRQENIWDIQLYEYAKMHLRKKDTEYPLRRQSFKEIAAPKTSIDYTFDLPINGRGWTFRDKLEELIQWPFYRWITDEPAMIYFNLEETRDYNISFIVRAFVPSDSMRVHINGREVILQKTEMPPFIQYHGKIHKEWLNEGLTEICFHPKEVFLYNNVKKMRYLWVSFAIHRICIN